PPKQKPASSGTSHWFDSVNDVKVSEPESPQRPKLPPPSPVSREVHGGPGNRNEERSSGGHRGPGSYQERHPGSGGYRGPGAYHNAPLSGSIVGGIGHRPRQPLENSAPGTARGPRPGGEHRIDKYQVGNRRGGKPAGQKKPKPVAAAAKPKREKIPPPEPFKPTPEQVAQVETRYIELAIPGEFDGIRSQIANEFAMPKKAVKQIVKALREREQIPSWWETQTYKGDTEEKEKIKNAYEPYLPVPPVGVHRKLADELDLKPGVVYQAIKAIRLEMNLPQYNDPTFHAAEFAEIQRKAREAKAAREAAREAAKDASEDASTSEQAESLEAQAVEVQSVQVMTTSGEGEQA
ncbi:MAG TPA: hypothetical protein VFN35_25925, partial [Ktedonobacteraceae bacterium]|nr:hypothetical protein [Ktedonobacteraceae bacterium]